MGQSDYSIQNATFPEVRADINDNLEAIASKNSGPVEPSPTFPYMEWVDESTGLLKIRNAANDGWISYRTIDSSLLDLVWPIGSIHENGLIPNNPSSYLGGGTWVSHGAGRVLVGLDPTDADFNTLGQTIGDKEVTLSLGQMRHAHRLPIGSDGGGVYAWHDGAGNPIFGSEVPSGAGGILANQRIGVSPLRIAYSEGPGQLNQSANEAHSNIQPSIVCYRWLRTA